MQTKSTRNVSKKSVLLPLGIVLILVGLFARTRTIVAVRVTLNYQSIPPYYLKQRFTIGRGPETQRLAYLASHLTVEGTPVDGWKLPLVCATRGVGDVASEACRSGQP